MPGSGISGSITSTTLQVGFLCHKEISENETVEEQKQAFKERAFRRIMSTGDFAEYSDADCILVEMIVQFKLTRNATVVENQCVTYKRTVYTSVDDSTEESPSEEGEESSSDVSSESEGSSSDVSSESEGSSSDVSSDSEYSEITCPICLEDFDSEMLRSLPCCQQQSICASCESRIRNCPFCRRRLPRGRGQQSTRGRGRGRGRAR